MKQILTHREQVMIAFLLALLALGGIVYRVRVGLAKPVSPINQSIVCPS